MGPIPTRASELSDFFSVSFPPLKNCLLPADTNSDTNRIENDIIGLSAECLNNTSNQAYLNRTAGKTWPILTVGSISQPQPL